MMQTMGKKLNKERNRGGVGVGAGTVAFKAKQSKQKHCKDSCNVNELHNRMKPGPG